MTKPEFINPLAKAPFQARYGNYIGGELVAPVAGDTSTISPITGAKTCEIARSTAADIELALDAAHKAKDVWGAPAPPSARSILLRSQTAWRTISSCSR